MKNLNFVKTIFVFLAITVMVGCGEDNTPAVNLAPEFEEETYTFEIAENASSGDALGAVSATDENASDILAYSITTTQTDFAMNATTGEVALAADAVLDYEAVVSYTLQVQVSDGATPALTATAEVTINVGDVNEFTPEFAQTSYSFSLAADAAVGDEVGKIAATDSDGTAMLSYTLSGEGAANFEIMDGTNVASGEEASVVVAANADLTSLVSPVKITIAVSDGENTVDAEVEITIAPVGTNAAPIFANTPYSFSLSEDAADGAVVGMVSATDSNAGDLLTYSLSGEGAANFAIMDGTNVASGEEASVVVAANADLPALVSPVTLTVEVSDGTDQVTANVEITIIEGNVAPVFVQTDYTFTTASDAADDAVVGTVSAVDSNAGDLLTYSLSGTDAGSFEIDNTAVASGTDVPITVAASANLSSLTSPVTLIVTVADDETPALMATANVEITIAAGNVAPVFDQTAYTFNVAEDAVSGAILGPVSATDSNDGDRLTYSLSGTDADHFAIDNTAVASGTPVPITVAASANLSSLTSPVTLIVMATDNETPALMATANVKITIIAGNVAPVFVQTDYTFTIAEGATDGAIVGNVSATDFNAGDLLAYTISGTDAGSFEIDNTAVASGTDVPITVAASANLPSLTSPVTLIVTVADDETPALMATANVEITITAGNVAPVFDQTAYTFVVNEDAESGKELGPVSATDSNTGNLLAYILSGTGADNFAIDHTAVASGTDVQITVSGTASLDHETTTSYTLEVQASDDASPALTATATVTINVNDINDNDPVFTGAPYTFSVDENSPTSTSVGMVSATDADAGTTLEYSIATSPTDFEMDANTGEIKVASATLDFETTTSYTLEVEASDGTNTATADVTINVGDVNDNDPVFAQASYMFNVNENSPASTVVDVVAATDADAGTTLEYSIAPSQTDFDIDSGTGEIKVASATLDFETTTSYTLEVEASDGTKTATADVTVNVDNVNEAPAFTGAPYTFSVDENSAMSTMVGTVAATDVDANTTLQYSIVPPQTDFDIDSGTGEITVASATLDFETTTSYTLEVQASDGATPALTATAAVTINVNDVNDNDPVFGEAAYTFELVGVNAESGDEVGTVAATDADAGATLEYSIATSPTEFDIDANTGIITVSDAATLSTATPSYTLMVQVDDGTNTAMANVTINILGVDYDMDGDGLIDINNLEQLNAMRWDLDGNGEVATADDATYDAAFPDAAAFATTPTGYELLRSLDFDEDDSYAGLEADQTWSEAQGTTSGGWEPIGNFTSETDFTPYTAVFDGNNYTLSNLYIARTDDTGLFASLSATSTVSNVGLLDVDIIVGDYVGSLVVYSSGGTITGCHATGSVSGSENMGGLVGWQNGGSITACYAMVAMSGANPNTGGLVGLSSGNSTITACYATGNVFTSDAAIGGLVGHISSGTVTACYATGTVDAFNGAGGLVGSISTGTVTASYYDSSTTGRSDTGKGTGQITSELQTPTVYDDDTDATNSSSIYETWNLDLDNADADTDATTGMDDPWDFGTSDQYPVLKIDFNNDGSTADDVTRQRQ